MNITERLSRRRILRGMLQGSAVTVALPFLECFLNSNGTALASGAPLPVRFATWFWGNGFTAGRVWYPEKTGSLRDQKLAPDLVALEKFKDQINIYSMLKIHLDGKPNLPHISGWHGQLAGTAPRNSALSAPTIDTMIANTIGPRTRYRSLAVSCTGNPASSMSYLAGGVQQPSEVSPAQLYARIFGPEFKDPNNADFKPDPRVMARRSVLSAIKGEREAMARDVSAADRVRLEEYFSSLRQLERQVEIQLEKPAPLAACTVLPKVPDTPIGTELEQSLATNKLMCNILAHALACDQTRVLNIAFSDPQPGLRLPGDATTYHTYSHQEPKDPKLGYQPHCANFSSRGMEGLAALIEALSSIKEGDRTLLDQTLVLANTDNGNAYTHAVENIPVITAGRAGGAMKTGLHVSSPGDPATRVGLTVMQALKLSLDKFGTESNETSRRFSEVIDEGAAAKA
jgi:hypothetical protein